ALRGPSYESTPMCALAFDALVEDEPRGQGGQRRVRLGRVSNVAPTSLRKAEPPVVLRQRIERRRAAGLAVTRLGVDVHRDRVACLRVQAAEPVPVLDREHERGVAGRRVICERPREQHRRRAARRTMCSRLSVAGVGRRPRRGERRRRESARDELRETHFLPPGKWIAAREVGRIPLGPYGNPWKEVVLLTAALRRDGTGTRRVPVPTTVVGTVPIRRQSLPVA